MKIASISMFHYRKSHLSDSSKRFYQNNYKILHKNIVIKYLLEIRKILNWGFCQGNLGLWFERWPYHFSYNFSFLFLCGGFSHSSIVDIFSFLPRGGFFLGFAFLSFMGYVHPLGCMLGWLHIRETDDTSRVFKSKFVVGYTR